MRTSCGAEFSRDLLYRYTLHRTWDENKPYCLWIMLNPSTADAVENDPTVERCERRAHAMGFGGVYVGNIFAWRSTDPSVLRGLADPIGSANDAHLISMAQRAGLVVCGWGKHGKLHGRGEAVLKLLRKLTSFRTGELVVPHALHINKDGTPQHPLYVSYSKQPEPIQ